MNIRKLHLVLAVFLMFFALSSIAYAGCQDQGCVRPDASGCYTCGGAAGYSCNVSGTCDSSCTENACPKSGGSDEEFLLTLAVPNLPVAPTTPAWELKDTLFATHFAPAAKPRQTRCEALVLPKNVLFAL